MRREERGTKKEERRLTELYCGLDAGRQKALLEFAECLAVRAAAPEESASREPVPIERPAEETVVMAIKRLTRTYPLLDKRRLLAETSHFIAKHALEGRPAHEVIDELELVFSAHYETLKSGGDRKKHEG